MLIQQISFSFTCQLEQRLSNSSYVTFSTWYIVANLPKAALNAERGKQEWVDHNRLYLGKEIAAESYSAMPRYLHVANAKGRAADVLDTATSKGSVYLTSHWK